MSAHCNTCGADIVYPGETWPIGECPVCTVKEKLEAARARVAELEAAGRRVAYAWENLRGWMPSGRGVPDWTTEMNAAVAALPAAPPEEKTLSAWIADAPARRPIAPEEQTKETGE